MTVNKIINPIHVCEGEYVDIHWRLKNGNVFIERRSCPPSATTEARQTTETTDAKETT